MTHGPFQLDRWWCRDTGYNCVIHLGRRSVHQRANEHDGQNVAELKAWRAMAEKLAYVRNSGTWERPLTPMNMGITE